MALTSKIALIVLPDFPIAAEVHETAQSWISSGLISNFFFTTPSLLGPDFKKDWKIQVKSCSEGIDSDAFDLLEQLGRSQPDRLELLTTWVLGEAEPSQDLIDSTLGVEEILRNVLSQRVDPASGRPIRPLATIAMAVYPFSWSADEKSASLASKIRSDLIVVCSPEVRAQPWAASAPLKIDDNFPPFVVAQIAAVCGLWSGFSDSIFSIVEKNSDQLATAQPLVVRTIGSIVVAEGVAEKVVLEALRKASDPNSSPFMNSSDNGSERPRAISPSQVDLINAELEKYLNRVLGFSSTAFRYDTGSSNRDLDLSRSSIEALKFFGQFCIKALAALPLFAWYGISNFGSSLVNKLMGNARDFYPESYSGLDKDVLGLKAELLKGLGQEEKLAQDAASTASFRQEPDVWRELRRIVFASLDGGPDVNVKSVLPLLENVFPDPDKQFQTIPEHREFIEGSAEALSALQIYELNGTLAERVKEVDLNIRDIHLEVQREQFRLANLHAETENEFQDESEPEFAEDDHDDDTELEDENSRDDANDFDEVMGHEEELAVEENVNPTQSDVTTRKVVAEVEKPMVPKKYSILFGSEDPNQNGSSESEARNGK